MAVNFRLKPAVLIFENIYDRHSLIAVKSRTGICVPALLVLLTVLTSPWREAEAQLTSSRTVAILPIVAPSSDSALAANLYKKIVTAIGPSVTRRGINVELTGQGLGMRELAHTLSQPMKMGDYAQRVGAAFLIGGGINRLPEGDLLVTMILYGVDDRKVIAAEWHIFEDSTMAGTGVTEMALRLSKPNNLTHSDTPIIYSIIVPGTGQIMLGEPVHAIFCSGLVTAAFLWKRGPQPMPADPYLAAKLKKTVKKRRLTRIVVAWLFNVVDTTLLCKLRVRKVDALLFFSMMDMYSHSPDILLQPAIGLRINFNFRK